MRLGDLPDVVIQANGKPLAVHAPETCEPPCPFHAPTEHPLKDAPIVVRWDRHLMIERLCEHGVGHPDPDNLTYQRAHGSPDDGAHGCDGCCTRQPEGPA